MGNPEDFKPDVLTDFLGTGTIRISRVSSIAPADRLMVNCLTLGVRAAQPRTWINARLLRPTGLRLRTLGTGDALGPAASE